MLTASLLNSNTTYAAVAKFPVHHSSKSKGIFEKKKKRAKKRRIGHV